MRHSIDDIEEFRRRYYSASFVRSHLRQPLDHISISRSERYTAQFRDEAFRRDVDTTIARGVNPPGDYDSRYPTSGFEREWAWAIESTPGLQDRMSRIHEAVFKYAAQLGEPWTDERPVRA